MPRDLTQAKFSIHLTSFAQAAKPTPMSTTMLKRLNIFSEPRNKIPGIVKVDRENLIQNDSLYAIKHFRLFFSLFILGVSSFQSMAATSPNLLTDPGFESGLSGFTLTSTQAALSTSSAGPIAGNQSLNFSMSKSGMGAAFTRSVQADYPIASKIDFSVVTRALASSSSRLRVCILATYASGQNAQQCLTASYLKTKASNAALALNLDSALPISNVRVSLHQVGTTRIQYLLDTAKLTITTPDDPSAPPPPPAATPSTPSPYVNIGAIPTGSPGSSTLDVSQTDEKPAVAVGGVGAFRNVCQFSHMKFDDPIVFPNQPGKSHLHTFFGNTKTDALSNADSLRSSGNGTCRGGILNRSGYWVPTLLNSEGVPQAPSEAHVYYKSGYAGIAANQINEFPQGLRMVAGDAKSSAPQPHSYWGCVNNYIGHPSYIPTCPAGDTIEMSVLFPQCWNGKDLDSPDHKSHMAYPENGACPSTHPVAIPEINIHVRYDMPAGGVAGWRLASDNYDSTLPGGYSSHGDWFEGWNREGVTAFINGCVRPGLDCHSHLLGDGRQMY